MIAKTAFSKAEINRLEEQARLLRLAIIEMLWSAGPERKGHPGGALSASDIVAALYFRIMNIDPSDPLKPDRDRFILSKGHACPVLYGALAIRGFFDSDHLNHFRRVGALLQGHPSRGIPGVDMTTGSLGHGLSAGIGMALAARIDKYNYNVFVLLGDGECQEGLIWEAAMAAPRYKLNNLVAIVDINKWQSCGTVKETLSLEPFADKWKSFGWNVIEINGNNMAEILPALTSAAATDKDCPTVILAHTIKGKGVSFMEDDNSWHQKAMTKEQYKLAVKELGGDMK